MGSAGYRHGEPVAVRLWRRVRRGGPDECWPYESGHRDGARPLIIVNGRPDAVYRVAWRLVNGQDSIPSGYSIKHSCANATCCNVAHMSAVPAAEAKGWRKGHRATTRTRRMVLDEERVVRARKLAMDGMAHTDIAMRLGAPLSAIRAAIHGTTWAHVTVVPPVPTRVPKMNAELAQAIRVFVRAGVAQKSVCEMLGVDPGLVSNIMAGRRYPEGK